MDWASIITTVLGSGALFTILNYFVEGVRQRRKDKGALRFLAMQLASRFEAYAVDCLDAHSENENHKSSSGHAGEPMGRLEPLPALPELDGYHLIEPSLLDRIYHLPLKRTIAERAVLADLEFANDEHGSDDELVEQNLALAQECRNLARELRRAAKLPPRQLTFKAYDIDQHLDDEVIRVAERRARNDRAQEESNVRLMTSLQEAGLLMPEGSLDAR